MYNSVDNIYTHTHTHTHTNDIQDIVFQLQTHIGLRGQAGLSGWPSGSLDHLT